MTRPCPETQTLTSHFKPPIITYVVHYNDADDAYYIVYFDEEGVDNLVCQVWSKESSDRILDALNHTHHRREQ